MNKMAVDSLEGLYSIIPLTLFRKTKGVTFDILPMDLVKEISSVDRVLHESGSVSPGPVNNVERPWYMHPHQEDNLLVLYGTRYVDLYTPQYGKIESFTITPEKIMKGDEIIFEGGAMLVWPCNVFHRVISAKEGSRSLNFGIRHEGFDIRTNFNIYDVDTENREYKVIREGYKDQF